MHGVLAIFALGVFCTGLQDMGAGVVSPRRIHASYSGLGHVVAGVLLWWGVSHWVGLGGISYACTAAQTGVVLSIAIRDGFVAGDWRGRSRILDNVAW